MRIPSFPTKKGIFNGGDVPHTVMLRLRPTFFSYARRFTLLRSRPRSTITIRRMADGSSSKRGSSRRSAPSVGLRKGDDLRAEVVPSSSERMWARKGDDLPAEVEHSSSERMWARKGDDLPAEVEHSSSERMRERAVEVHENQFTPPLSEGGRKDSGVFDICPVVKNKPVKLKPSLLATNKEKRKQAERLVNESSFEELAPGMVILRNYLSLQDQVNIVKQCRNLGVDSGGFYQPGYRDGAKLSLQMMCLGKDWDPETKSYGDVRRCDGAKPPPIPNDFVMLVKKAIAEAHNHLYARLSSPEMLESTLPNMSPDICIVNFYTQSGKLGLHQDKDETPESLQKGLPVVSFSIGEAAVFAYSENRSDDSAETIELRSGDVLIFGGQSRMIYHGVPSISSNSAPKPLLEETNLRTGRLNLTFRKY